MTTIESDKQRIRELGELLKVNLPTSVLAALANEKAELTKRVRKYA